ncbi:MAG: hypothetical protein FJW37_14830 [Acidobacteria bacterium]|nr:hypothetical protein [Acidobacteriota bacterium]
MNAGFGAVPIGDRPIIAPQFMDPNLAVGYNHHFNLNVQHQLNNGLFFELGWLANMGHKLQGGLGLNQVHPSRVGPATTQRDRPFPQFSNITQLSAGIFNSSYHGLVLKVEKRFAGGLSFVSHYTWSKFLDDFAQSSLYNRQVNKGRSSDHVAGRFVFSGSYDLPFGKGRRFATKGPLAHLAGGWNLGALNIFQSGRALTPSATPNQCNCFSIGGVRPNLIGDPEGPKSIHNWFNVAAFEHPGPFRFGNSAPGVITGPGLWTLDVSLAKDIAFNERLKLNVRGDFYNLPNRANFDNPILSIFPAGASGTTNVIRSAQDPRVIQLSARFLF